MPIVINHADHLGADREVMPNYGWVRIALPSRDFYRPEEDSYNRHAREVRLSRDDSWGLIGLTGLGRQIFTTDVLHSIGLYEVWTGVHFADDPSCFRFRWQALRPEGVKKFLIRADWNSVFKTALADRGAVEVGDLLAPIS